MKLCKPCGEIKPFYDFANDKTKHDGLRSWCKNCSQKYRDKNKQNFKKYRAEIRSSPIGRARDLIRAAGQRSDNVSITAEWVANKIEAGVCELTGLPFDLQPSEQYGRNPYAPSLDRKDSKNRNYDMENSRIVLWAVNSALSEFTGDTMLPILKAMVLKLENK